MTEYNSMNERFKKQYEEALLHGAHRDRKTVHAVWQSISLFEEFTGKKNFTTFNKEQAKAFKRHLESTKNKNNVPLSLSTIRSTLANVREFFKWLTTHPQCIRKVDGQAVIYLRLSNNQDRAARASRERPVPTIMEIRKTLKLMPASADSQKRDRAIMAFTALTGMRDDALVSLKVKDVDLEKEEVWQNPRHVRTKGRKSITTYFMDFDPLWSDIVKTWINYIVDDLNFSKDAPLFPKDLVINNPNTMMFENAGLSREHWSNANPVRQIFKLAFQRAGLKYYHPHSFRKMLVLWAMENCSQYQVKAISQNVGHENIATTYNSYGNLSLLDQRAAILSIDRNGGEELANASLEKLMEEIARRVKK